MSWNTLRGGGVPRITQEMFHNRFTHISLIPLWLSPVNRTARVERGKKAGTRATPPKIGGSCGLG